MVIVQLTNFIRQIQKLSNTYLHLQKRKYEFDNLCFFFFVVNLQIIGHFS